MDHLTRFGSFCVSPYVLINGGGSGGGERGLRSLRRFAAEVMPGFVGGELDHAAQ